MRIFNRKTPLLLAFMLALCFGLSAQQNGDGVSSPGSGSEEMKEKKALYEQLGVKWAYDETPELEKATQTKSVAAPVTLAVSEREQMEQEFEQNREAWLVQDPARYNRYRAELGMLELPEATEPKTQDEIAAKKSNPPSTK